MRIWEIHTYSIATHDMLFFGRQTSPAVGPVRHPNVPGSMEIPSIALESKHHHISRIDSHSIELHGWQVRVQRQKKQYSRFFADVEHGSPENALDAAKTYRDELMAELPASGSNPQAAAFARNKSGVRGLWVASKGNGTLYVQVGLRDENGRLHSSSFSLSRFGPRKALWNAVAALNRLQRKLGMPEQEPTHMFQAAFRYVHERAV
ncbi:MAG: AP2 domain-containing protein [Rhodothermales bacterium]